MCPIKVLFHHFFKMYFQQIQISPLQFILKTPEIVWKTKSDKSKLSSFLTVLMTLCRTQNYKQIIHNSKQQKASSEVSKPARQKSLTFY